MKKLPRSEYKIMPWKNGLGTTAEIDRFPAEGPYLWRLSQATVRVDGPFSVFPGYDRWLAIWNGGPMFLNDRELTPRQPLRFSGDDEVFCRVTSAPVLDVGLIFDRSKIEASMSFVEGAIQLAPGKTHYLFDLESGDTLRTDEAADLRVRSAFLISIFRRD